MLEAHRAGDPAARAVHGDVLDVDVAILQVEGRDVSDDGDRVAPVRHVDVAEHRPLSEASHAGRANFGAVRLPDMRVESNAVESAASIHGQAVRGERAAAELRSFDVRGARESFEICERGGRVRGRVNGLERRPGHGEAGAVRVGREPESLLLQMDLQARAARPGGMQARDSAEVHAVCGVGIDVGDERRRDMQGSRDRHPGLFDLEGARETRGVETQVEVGGGDGLSRDDGRRRPRRGLGCDRAVRDAPTGVRVERDVRRGGARREEARVQVTPGDDEARARCGAERDGSRDVDRGRGRGQRRMRHQVRQIAVGLDVRAHVFVERPVWEERVRGRRCHAGGVRGDVEVPAFERRIAQNLDVAREPVKRSVKRSRKVNRKCTGAARAGPCAPQPEAESIDARRKPLFRCLELAVDVTEPRLDRRAIRGVEIHDHATEFRVPHDDGDAEALVLRGWRAGRPGRKRAGDGRFAVRFGKQIDVGSLDVQALDDDVELPRREERLVRDGPKRNVGVRVGDLQHRPGTLVENGGAADREVRQAQMAYRLDDQPAVKGARERPFGDPRDESSADGQIHVEHHAGRGSPDRQSDHCLDTEPSARAGAPWRAGRWLSDQNASPSPN